MTAILTAVERRPSTFGAGTPAPAVRPMRRAVGNIIRPTPPEWLPVIDEVCARHKIHRRDMLNGWQSDKACAARREIWFEIMQRFKPSLNQLGRRTGGYHHTSVRKGLAIYETTRSGSFAAEHR